MLFSCTEIQMASKQTRSRQFIEGLNDIVQMVTTNESDSSHDPVDEEDMVF